MKILILPAPQLFYFFSRWLLGWLVFKLNHSLMGSFQRGHRLAENPSALCWQGILGKAIQDYCWNSKPLPQESLPVNRRVIYPARCWCRCSDACQRQHFWGRLLSYLFGGVCTSQGAGSKQERQPICLSQQTHSGTVCKLIFQAFAYLCWTKGRRADQSILLYRWEFMKP